MEAHEQGQAGEAMQGAAGTTANRLHMEAHKQGQTGEAMLAGNGDHRKPHACIHACAHQNGTIHATPLFNTAGHVRTCQLDQVVHVLKWVCATMWCMSSKGFAMLAC